MRRFLNTLKFLLAAFALFAFFIWYTQEQKPAINPGNENPSAGQEVQAQEKNPANNSKQIPVYVIKVLNYIQKHDVAPDGYVGGRTFFNRERRLPVNDTRSIKIKYREWDVHPKKPGQSRGAERLVTGSNGKAYYTRDHYRSFITIQ